MSEKFYQIGTHTESDWDSLHADIINEGTSCPTVPHRCIVCDDDKPHSPTRGTYLLTDEEAEILKSDSRVRFINIDYSKYPEIYKPPSEELQASTPELLNRYTGAVKNYRRVSGLNQADINRTGYQLLRCQQKLDPWVENNYSDTFVVESNISQYGTGKNIDIIVADDGMWFGHPEFQNNATSALTAASVEKPFGYIGGNQLPGNGTCDLLDLVLDAPYYLDSAWFNASPGTRLTTRWDGTIVPVESVARAWWSNATQRSAQFASAGTVLMYSNYTRANNNGSNSTLSTVGDHGTPCCALTYGRTQGWAYNSNKWAFNLYNTYGTDIEPGFDLVKLFHQLKPVNPTYGNKNPTVMSNSWGYRSNKGSTNGYYHFRTDGPVQYSGTSNEPEFISHLGQTGDDGRWKSEMKINSLTTALDELIESGIIFVGAAGNSNQKQVGSSHPDWNNYISSTSIQTLEQSNYFEFGVAVTGSTNRRGFPQQGGMYDFNGTRFYPTINIGALDDNYKISKEAKVNYSDRGEEIDVYAPADGTLAANRGYSSVGLRPDTYPSYERVSAATDTTFGGTSAACPVAAGFIATVLEYNRNWGWQDIKSWLSSLDNQSSNAFYYGVESTTATSSNWFDYEGLEGGSARVLYQGNINVSNIFSRKRIRGNFKIKGNLILRFRQ